jgi:alkylation response protein AidB-like acyl-CoA dehydrogenase
MMRVMELEGVRGEVAAFLAERWDPDLSLSEWRVALAESGWACPSWPLEWFGRGLPPAADELVASELRRVGAVGAPPGSGMSLAGPTILAHGSDDIRQRFLRGIVTGADTWCQLFSEPGSGSDLAGLTTRAELDGDEWVVNGQKVWTTSAHHARYGLLLARTDWDATKREGISYLILDLHQPGVVVRPLRQMNGHASFNEVFLTDARVPRDDVIGEVNRGWPVAMHTLAVERRGFAAAARTRPGSTGGGRCREEADREAAEVMAPYVWYPQRYGRVDLLVPQLRASGRAHDAVARHAVVHALALARIESWTAERARVARSTGRAAGPEGSIGKLGTSRLARAAAGAHGRIAGAGGLLSDADGPLAGIVSEVLISVPAVSIAGGTDEIQHNIVAERVLGLPKEPPADAGPFRDIPRNPGRDRA